MVSSNLAVAFSISAAPLSFRSTFSGPKTKLSQNSLPVARRQNRARIVALGAAPSPPPNDPEEGADKPDAPPEAVPNTESDAAASDAPPEEITADDILNSPAFLKKKLEIVQKELIDAKAALEEDSDAVKEEKARYVRLAADFENYRRRSMEDLRKQDAKSTAKVCKEILDVLDNFERASANVKPETEREKTISSSYQSINKQLLDALVRLKVEPIDSVGAVFDPEFHEAIQRMESQEHNEDVVCAQFQRGYRIGETLIRAAVVGVSTGPGPEGEDEEEKEAIDVEGSPDEADEDIAEHPGEQ